MDGSPDNMMNFMGSPSEVKHIPAPVSLFQPLLPPPAFVPGNVGLTNNNNNPFDLLSHQTDCNVSNDPFESIFNTVCSYKNPASSKENGVDSHSSNVSEPSIMESSILNMSILNDTLNVGVSGPHLMTTDEKTTEPVKLEKEDSAKTFSFCSSSAMNRGFLQSTEDAITTLSPASSTQSGPVTFSMIRRESLNISFRLDAMAAKKTRSASLPVSGLTSNADGFISSDDDDVDFFLMEPPEWETSQIVLPEFSSDEEDVFVTGTTDTPSTGYTACLTNMPSIDNVILTTNMPSTSYAIRSTNMPSTNNVILPTDEPSTGTILRTTNTPSTDNVVSDMPALVRRYSLVRSANIPPTSNVASTIDIPSTNNVAGAVDVAAINEGGAIQAEEDVATKVKCETKTLTDINAILPLSQANVRHLALRCQPLVGAEKAPEEEPRLRRRVAPPNSKGPMRAIIPLGSMTKNVATKKPASPPKSPAAPLTRPTASLVISPPSNIGQHPGTPKTSYRHATTSTPIVGINSLPMVLDTLTPIVRQEVRDASSPDRANTALRQSGLRYAPSPVKRNPTCTTSGPTTPSRLHSGVPVMRRNSSLTSGIALPASRISASTGLYKSRSSGSLIGSPRRLPVVAATTPVLNKRRSLPPVDATKVAVEAKPATPCRPQRSRSTETVGSSKLVTPTAVARRCQTPDKTKTANVSKLLKPLSMSSSNCFKADDSKTRTAPIGGRLSGLKSMFNFRRGRQPTSEKENVGPM